MEAGAPAPVGAAVQPNRLVRLAVAIRDGAEVVVSEPEVRVEAHHVRVGRLRLLGRPAHLERDPGIEPMLDVAGQCKRPVERSDVSAAGLCIEGASRSSSLEGARGVFHLSSRRTRLGTGRLGAPLSDTTADAPHHACTDPADPNPPSHAPLHDEVARGFPRFRENESATRRGLRPHPGRRSG